MPILDGNTVGVKSLANQVQIASSTSINGKLAQDIYNMELLHQKIFDLIIPKLENYSLGAFDQFTSEMTEEFIIGVTKEINNSDEFIYNNTVINDPDLFFTLSNQVDNNVYNGNLPEKYVAVANEIMNIIKQILSDRQKISRLEVENENCKTYQEILEDPQKLNDYIKEVQSTSYLFTAEATYHQPIEIKPWYQQYLIQYGPPGDGVFDSEKLGVIIQQLIAIGQISEDTVIS